MEKLDKLYPSLTAGISDNEDAIGELVPKLKEELELRKTTAATSSAEGG